MRKQYCCEASRSMYENYYAKQAKQGGGDMPVFVGGRYQRGHGLGNFFAGLRRFVVPIAERGAAFLLPRLIKMGKEIVSDVKGGTKIKEALKSRIPKAIKEAASDLGFQSGSGLRKRKTVGRRKPIKRLKL